MKVSPGSVDDAPRAAALYNAAFDDRVITAAGLRHRQTSAVPEDGLMYWRVEDAGELVGWCFAGRDVFAPDRVSGFVGILVHPERRGRGAGSALWDVASAHLEEIGARRIVANTLSDEESVSFARARGFTLEATDTTSAVDPRAVGDPPAPGAGLAIAPMAHFAEDPTSIFEADRISALDEPGASDYSGMTYPDWRRLIWDMPDCDHDVSVVVLADGVVVGASFLYTDYVTGRARNAGTGVVPDFRGRGLGLLMKRHALALAAARGITRVITQNDDTNAPMLAINAKLGYEPLSKGHSWVLER
jgi:GNAT superfamily N-acetyltransferase